MHDMTDMYDTMTHIHIWISHTCMIPHCMEWRLYRWKCSHRWQPWNTVIYEGLKLLRDMRDIRAEDFQTFNVTHALSKNSRARLLSVCMYALNIISCGIPRFTNNRYWPMWGRTEMSYQTATCNCLSLPLVYSAFLW